MFFFDLFPPSSFMLRTILSSSSLLATYVPSTFSLPPSLRPSLHLMDFFSLLEIHFSFLPVGGLVVFIGLETFLSGLT